MKSLFSSGIAAMAIAATLNADEISTLKSQLSLLSERLAALEANDKKQTEQTQTLTDELINVQNATSFTTIDSSKTVQGLGSAASKIYYSKNPLSIGGYGELYYSHQQHTGSDETEAYRFVPYIGYKFSDTIILNSEIEFEHGGQEIAIEQLYVDFLLDPSFSIRLGHQLVPVGLINLNHEPVLYNTVRRPEVETYLIPSTWHENGITVYGALNDIEYTIGTVVALDMGLANHDGTPDADTTGKNWIRDGRRMGNENNNAVSNMGGVARLDYKGINGLAVGGSLYTGKAGAAKVAGMEEGRMSMFDVHAQYQTEGFKIRALYTESHLSNAEAYDPAMPKKGRGGYLNLEYNVLPFFTQSTISLPLFFQYENYNLAAQAAGDKRFGDTESFTYGLNFFPHDQVVLKGEYKHRNNRNGVNTYQSEGIYSVGLGFIF